MFTIYIIYSARLDRYYTGYTSDMNKRLLEHNSGISSFTSKANDWELQYTELIETREAAMQRERFIKSRKSRQYLVDLIRGKKR